MPTYDFHCNDCDKTYEITTKRDKTHNCKHCKKKLERQIHFPKIAFKGTGFTRSAATKDTPQEIRTKSTENYLPPPPSDNDIVVHL